MFARRKEYNNNAHQEIILLVAFGGLALDVPVVLPGHLVLVGVFLHVLHARSDVAASFLQRLLCRETVGHELLAAFVHHTSEISEKQLVNRSFT